MKSRGFAWSNADRFRRGLTLSWLVLFVFSILLQYGNLTNPQGALAVHDTNVFELDGDADNDAVAGDDWQNVFVQPPASDFVNQFIHDPINSTPDELLFTGGDSKDIDDIDDWRWTSGPGVQDKNDIADAFAAGYDVGGDLVVYFGLDRYASNGDAQTGFWFLQGPFGLNGDGTFSGVHTIGDILVQIDFQNGGANPILRVYEWVGSGGDTSGTLDLVAAGGSCATTPAGDLRCAIANTTDQPSPWAFTPKSGSANVFPAGSFVEGGINLTDLGLDQGCFASFVAETRSSQSPTATLSDFAFGSFSLCETPSLTTQVSGSSITIGSGSVTDTAHLSGTKGVPTGTVDFFLCGPTGSAVNCAAGGTDAGQDKAINGSGDATSNAMAPTAPGWYCFRAEYTPAAGSKYLATSHTNSTTECFEVLKRDPAIVTSATQSVSAGEAIHDSATLSGGFNPTGTITFNAYGPDDATCAGAAVYSDSVAVSGNGTYGPVSFTPAVAGVYRWIASYSGDANNNAVSGACNDAGETDTVNKVQPSIATSANESVTIGDSISDSATLSGGVDPTGTITFSAYGPDDATCSGLAAFSTSVAVAGNGTYGPVSFPPSAVGTYRWIASYSGDANNEPASGACNDAGETDTVVPAEPDIVTSANESVVVGGEISDSATLSGGVDPTGTITFDLYGPDDATCDGPVVFTESVTVSGNGTYGPVTFTPDDAGTYHWIASYSGDASNEPAAGACGDTGENDTVTPRNPTISTLLTDGETSGQNLTFPIGTTVTDSATLAGATDDAGGTVTYTVYTDSSCENEFADAGTADVTNGVVGDSDPVTFNAAGTYYWQAVYSGDANNNGATSACTDEVVEIVPNEVTINTLLSGQGNEGSEITVQIGNTVTDSAVLTGETADAGGTVTYTVYSDDECSVVFADGGTVDVTNGDVPDSDAILFDQAGTFYWQAEYSGDANNEAAISACTDEIVTVVVPAIDIVKSVDDADHIVGPGQLLTYTLELTVVNGPVTSSVVSDPLPEGQEFVSASDGGLYDATSHTITWDLGTLQSGDPAEVLTYQVTVAADAAPGDQPNTATFDTQETGPEDDDELVSVPALVIDKSFTGNTAGTAVNGVQIANVGDTLTYTLAYDLTGGPVNNGVITDTLPVGLTYVDGSATGNAEFSFVDYDDATRTLTWHANLVSADGTVTYQVTVDEDSFDLPQPLVNVAAIDSDETPEDNAEDDVLVQEVLEETSPPTLPPTDSIDSGDQAPSSPGFGLMLALLALAGFGLVAGYLTPTPGRARRQEVRRR